MTEEEASHLRKENAELKEALVRKDQRIEELEGLLMSALLRNEERERRLAKDRHNSSKPPSSDGFKRTAKKRAANQREGKRGTQDTRWRWSRRPIRSTAISRHSQLSLDDAQTRTPLACYHDCGF